MKKILSVILLLSCLLTVCSCSFIKDKFGIGGAATGLKAFEDAIKNCNASNVDVKSVVETELGSLTSTIKASYKEDGSATITYTEEKWNDALSATEELKTVKTYTFNRAADGTYTGDVPAGLDLASVTASAAINFDPIKDVAVINEASDVFTATVPAASTADVFGSAFSKDVNLEISLKTGVLNTIELTFEGGKITYVYG